MTTDTRPTTDQLKRRYFQERSMVVTLQNLSGICTASGMDEAFRAADAWGRAAARTATEVEGRLGAAWDWRADADEFAAVTYA